MEGKGIMRVDQCDDRTLREAVLLASPHEAWAVIPEDIFAELVGHLDEYAPSWYSEDQYERAHAALRIIKSS